MGGPLGPWGASRGVPGGENNPQLKVWEVTLLGFFIAQNHVVFDVDFWPFWARSWVPLGAHFRSCWRLGRPKLVPKPSSDRLNIEKVIFQKNERHPRREHDFEVQVGPRWRPRRPKIAPRRVQDRLGLFFVPLDFSLRFLILLGPFGCRFEVPKGAPGVG